MAVQRGPASAHIALGLANFGTVVARLLTRLNRPVEIAADRKHPIRELLA